MVGHHPPNCYPANGWAMASSEGEPFEFGHAGDHVIAGRLYRFTRGGADNSQLWVMNGFFDRKGGFVDHLEAAESLASGSAFSSGAMFQFQILFQGDFRSVDIQQYASEILSGIPEDVLVAQDIAEGQAT